MELFVEQIGLLLKEKRATQRNTQGLNICYTASGRVFSSSRGENLSEVKNGNEVVIALLPPDSDSVKFLVDHLEGEFQLVTPGKPSGITVVGLFNALAMLQLFSARGSDFVLKLK